MLLLLLFFFFISVCFLLSSLFSRISLNSISLTLFIKSVVFSLTLSSIIALSLYFQMCRDVYTKDFTITSMLSIIFLMSHNSSFNTLFIEFFIHIFYVFNISIFLLPFRDYLGMTLGDPTFSIYMPIILANPFIFISSSENLNSLIFFKNITCRLFLHGTSRTEFLHVTFVFALNIFPNFV